jgi:hypothetical protein
LMLIPQRTQKHAVHRTNNVTLHGTAISVKGM